MIRFDFDIIFGLWERFLRVRRQQAQSCVWINDFRKALSLRTENADKFLSHTKLFQSMKPPQKTAYSSLPTFSSPKICTNTLSSSKSVQQTKSPQTHYHLRVFNKTKSAESWFPTLLVLKPRRTTNSCSIESTQSRSSAADTKPVFLNLRRKIRSPFDWSPCRPPDHPDLGLDSEVLDRLSLRCGRICSAGFELVDLKQIKVIRCKQNYEIWVI